MFSFEIYNSLATSIKSNLLNNKKEKLKYIYENNDHDCVHSGQGGGTFNASPVSLDIYLFALFLHINLSNSGQ